MISQPLWNEAQEAYRLQVSEWARENLAPQASRWEREGSIPREVWQAMGQQGYWGAWVGAPYNSRADNRSKELGIDPVCFGLLNMEVGQACTAARNALTVHSMVCQALSKWGGTESKERWLSDLASGRCLGAFALSEPNVGSDARSVESEAVWEESGNCWRLNGHKKWITLGQIAGIFVVLARAVVPGKEAGANSTVALLVERSVPGLEVRPLRNLIATNSAGPAELIFHDCRVPKNCTLSRPGFGLAVCSSALEVGRLSVAWGSVGLARACLSLASAYASQRRQFGETLNRHQLVQAMLADMMVGTRAAALLCYKASAGYLKANAVSVSDILTAKYFASENAMRAAGDCVQILGANGCCADYPAERYLREAKIGQIIEGSSQIIQTLLAGMVRLDV